MRQYLEKSGGINHRGHWCIYLATFLRYTLKSEPEGNFRRDLISEA